MRMRISAFLVLLSAALLGVLLGLLTMNAVKLRARIQALEERNPPIVEATGD